MQYRDLVIHTNAHTLVSYKELNNSPPIRKRLQLSEGVWLGPIEPDVAEMVMETCAPKTFGVTPPFRQFGQLYSFVRELPNDSDIYHWYHDHKLTAVIALSRLFILPSSALHMRPDSDMKRAA